ncbi:glycosyltransferase family 2 protein [Mesorhizobium sp. ANAO-SY3R2]|uniref:glycosyltransferase family 2 protein n=1 Tax=Mesorhizobium sp. ANAO-SY3R2 TaxID=3166644 RepID=UPI00366FEF4E
MLSLAGMSEAVLLFLFFGVQGLYSLSMAVNIYFRTLPTNKVEQADIDAVDRNNLPFIVLYYPVLRELEATMRTTFRTIANIDYPKRRFRVVSIPNADDRETIASLRRLKGEFSFLEVIEVPPTSDPRWSVVWHAWDNNPKAYWWHQGARARNRSLPPKKTRQLIYAFYNTAKYLLPKEDFLINYIDADSCPPRDHFIAGAAGIKKFDVLQAQNIAGNLLDSMAATWHAADHMAWDGLTYPHISADGKQPFWVLGKGLFFKASDLVKLGGFHPWTTIEDPEVGMRFWINGKRIGIIENPLIEEVPTTIAHGITQRKRWVCGFFQSLSSPLKAMGYSRWQRFRAWLNFLPCLSLSINSIGFPVGVWAIWSVWRGDGIIPQAGVWLSWANVTILSLLLASLYVSIWKRTRLVLDTRLMRAWYILRVNPVSIMIWWLIWCIPLWIGFQMFRKDGGLVWERTVKIDANHNLIRLDRGQDLPEQQTGLPTAAE